MDPTKLSDKDLMSVLELLIIESGQEPLSPDNGAQLQAYYLEAEHRNLMVEPEEVELRELEDI